MVEIYASSETEDPLKAIQYRLNILLKNKIQDNLSKRYYPAVTAALIYSLGLSEPEKINLEIHQFLLTELKEKFITLYNSTPEIALDMIPKDTNYDSDSKKLIRKHPIQWVRDKTLQELKLESH